MAQSPIRKPPARTGEWSKFWIPLALVVATILLGWVGFYQYFRDTGRPIGVFDAFFYAAGLPIMQGVAMTEPASSLPLSLNIARVMGLIVLPYAFVLTFLALFGDLTKPVRIRSWRWRRRSADRGHAVVCGLGPTGYEIARDLIAKGRRVAVAELDPDNGLIIQARAHGAVILHGDATQLPLLRALDVAAAEKVFVVCGSGDTNVRILQQIGTLVGAADGRDTPLRCIVEVPDPRIRDFTHRSLSADPQLYVSSFDTFETTARQLLQAHPVDRFPEDGSGERVAVGIFGFSPMARAILFQTLLLGHLPVGRKLHITVLTEDPAADHLRFLESYPCFRPDAYGGNGSAEALRRQVLPSCEFLPLPESDAVLLDERGALMSSLTPDSVASIFICLDDGLRSASYASAIAPSAGRARRQGADVRLCYYHTDPDGEHRALVERSLRSLVPDLPVVAFDNFLDGCSVDRVEGRPADDLAREIARFYQQEYGGAEWRYLSEPDRMANRRAADHVPVKLRAIGAEIVSSGDADRDFRLSEGEAAALAEMEHRRWAAEKLLTGWRPLPRTAENLRRWRDHKEELKAQKLHIDLVPFEELSEDDQGKDRSQIEGIPTFLAALGLGIRRGCRAQPSARSSRR